MIDVRDELRILQVSTADVLGGAENCAWSLHQAYRLAGHKSWMVVGRKRSYDPNVIPILGYSGGDLRTKAWRTARRQLQPMAGRLAHAGQVKAALRAITYPSRWREIRKGREDFDHPSTYGMLGLTPERPTVVHCHNLHGGYFDLRALPWLSSQVPTILTLHDAWLLSGHCAHSLGCERWQTGCGQCPNLKLYPAIRRDATVFNWQRKRDIFAASHLHVATPCRWLMEKVERSMLAPAIVEARVIPNGADLSVFRPAHRPSAREMLGIPQQATMLLFVAYGARTNPWKDYETIKAAVAQVADRLEREVLCLALGEGAPTERIGRAEIRFVPFESDPSTVARYYQAADVYVHAAHAETMGLTITEALACGVPVVVTAVGGIPEQVRDARTGFLTAPGDVRAMAEAVTALLSDDNLLGSMGKEAAEDARRRFDFKRQANTYLDWYQEIS